jgi:hypothetical protein
MSFPYPPSDDSHARLKAAGWSVGYVGVGSHRSLVWQVTGTNGENRVEGHGRTLNEAYWRACQQAEAVGMLGRARRP